MRIPHVLLTFDAADAPAAPPAAGRYGLMPQTERHLRTVLRLRPGAPLTVTDGRGGRADAELTDDGVTTGAWEVQAAPAPLTLHPSLAKGAKLDFVVEKATELGVSAIVPTVCERSERRWDAERAAKQVARWTTIAQGALEQSHGVWLPQLAPPRAFAVVVAEGAAGVICHTAGAAADAGDAADPLAVWASPAAARVAVGPEGGFTDAEVATAVAAGWRLVSLGPRVVRTETASLLVAVLAGRERGRFAPDAAP